MVKLRTNARTRHYLRQIKTKVTGRNSRVGSKAESIERSMNSLNENNLAIAINETRCFIRFDHQHNEIIVGVRLNEHDRQWQ